MNYLYSPKRGWHIRSSSKTEHQAVGPRVPNVRQWDRSDNGVLLCHHEALGTSDTQFREAHPPSLHTAPIDHLQTSKDYILPPTHKTKMTIGIILAAGRLVVIDGDAEEPLCITALPYRKESGREDS